VIHIKIYLYYSIYSHKYIFISIKRSSNSGLFAHMAEALACLRTAERMWSLRMAFSDWREDCVFAANWEYALKYEKLFVKRVNFRAWRKHVAERVEVYKREEQAKEQQRVIKQMKVSCCWQLAYTSVLVVFVLVLIIGCYFTPNMYIYSVSTSFSHTHTSTLFVLLKKKIEFEELDARMEAEEKAEEEAKVQRAKDNKAKEKQQKMYWQQQRQAAEKASHNK
jgi:hypothetical protein